MRYCDHEFFKIKDDVDYQINTIPASTTSNVPIQLEKSNSIHTVVICVYCGQVRHLYVDGRVLIVKEEGEVTKTYGKTSDTNNRS